MAVEPSTDLSPRLLAFGGPTTRFELDDAPLVLTVNLDGEASGDAFEEAASWRWLTTEEHARARRFVRRRDGRRFATCRGALRAVLGIALEVEPAGVAFRSGPGGKPLLASNGPPPLHFNVTHSGDMALIALSRRSELGVDVEKSREIDLAGRIVESYFTADEGARFVEYEDAARPIAFLRGWTRKEAVLKAQGVGLAGLATDFETHFGVESLGPRFTRCTPFASVLGWSLWEAAPHPDYLAALAVAEA